MDASLLWIAGSGCCCFAVIVAIIALGSVLMRPRRPKAAELRGSPPAPKRGIQASASLTRMEEGGAVPGPTPGAAKGPEAGGPRVIPPSPTKLS